MGILRVMALLWATSSYAITTPANDIYSDSLTITRASAEVPQSLEASTSENQTDQASANAAASDEQPIESVSDLVKSAKPKAKKSARK